MVNFVRGRECFVGLYILFVYVADAWPLVGGRRWKMGHWRQKYTRFDSLLLFCVSSFDSVIVFGKEVKPDNNFKTLDFMMNLKCKM